MNFNFASILQYIQAFSALAPVLTPLISKVGGPNATSAMNHVGEALQSASNTLQSVTNAINVIHSALPAPTVTAVPSPHTVTSSKAGVITVQ